MSHFKTHQALVAAFNAGNFFPEDDVAYENFQFTPPTDRPSSKLFFMPASSKPVTMGPPSSGGADLYLGLLQADINYPVNEGSAGAMLKFVAIRNYFSAGRKFQYDGQTVTIRSTSLSPGRLVDGVFRISATISFRAKITR